jgi:malate synthase
VRKIRDEELARIRSTVGDGYAKGHYDEAASLFDEVALSRDFVDFLTVPGYARLD